MYGLFRYLDQVPGRGRPSPTISGSVRKSQSANSPQLAAHDDLADRFLLRPEVPLQHHALVASDDAANADLRQLAVHRARMRSIIGVGISPNAHGAIDAGVVAVLGRLGPIDGRGVLSRRFFVRRSSSLVRSCRGSITRCPINNNISQLGVRSGQRQPRTCAYSASCAGSRRPVSSGPRGGFGDLENHTRAGDAVRFRPAQSREVRGALGDQPPTASQIKLSDGINPFETGALADRRHRVTTLTYRELGDRRRRQIPRLLVPERVLLPHAQRLRRQRSAAAHVDLRPRLHGGSGVHGRPENGSNCTRSADTSHDQFRRYPWEAAVASTTIPRARAAGGLNLHVMHVDKCPASSFFGYYLAGQTGTILSLGTDVLF